MYRRMLLSGVLFFVLSALNAQTLRIQGIVIDQQRKVPLQGATVRLQSTTNSLISKTQLSDSTGGFIFSELAPDSFQLSISFVGFNTITRNIRLDSSEISMAVNLVPGSSQELATVIITSSPPVAVQKGDTLQISADQFKVNPDASGEDLVKKVPGITIENGQVKAQGENVQKVTI